MFEDILSYIVVGLELFKKFTQETVDFLVLKLDRLTGAKADQDATDRLLLELDSRTELSLPDATKSTLDADIQSRQEFDDLKSAIEDLEMERYLCHEKLDKISGLCHTAMCCAVAQKVLQVIEADAEDDAPFESRHSTKTNVIENHC